MNHIPMMLVLLLACEFFHSNNVHAKTMNCSDFQKELISYSMTDDDFRQYICGDNECDSGFVSDKIEIEQYSLKNGITGCFVKPVIKAENYFTTISIIRDGNFIPQFVFFGSGIAPIKKTWMSHFKIEGVERIEASHYLRTRYSWNGKNYVQTYQKYIYK